MYGLWSDYITSMDSADMREQLAHLEHYKMVYS